MGSAAAVEACSLQVHLVIGVVIVFVFSPLSFYFICFEVVG